MRKALTEFRATFQTVCYQLKQIITIKQYSSNLNSINRTDNNLTILPGVYIAEVMKNKLKANDLQSYVGLWKFLVNRISDA